jgi:hypothetical protein
MIKTDYLALADRVYICLSFTAPMVLFSLLKIVISYMSKISLTI